MPTLSLANRRHLAFGDTGGGTPLVLVHGSPGDGRAWSRVARHLAPGFRVLTPDLPGYGGSDAVPAGAGTAEMATAIGELIGGMAEPVWVAGHSYGGNVALHAALAHRDRIRGLILFEPVFIRALALAGERDVLEMATRHFDDYVRRVEGGDAAAIDRMIDFWFGTGAFGRLPPPVQGFLIGAAPKNAADVRAAFRESVTEAALTGFDRPALIAYGGKSPPVAPIIARSLAKLMPHAESVPIEGASHGMLDTHAEAVARVIQRHSSG